MKFERVFYAADGADGGSGAGPAAVVGSGESGTAGTAGQSSGADTEKPAGRTYNDEQVNAMILRDSKKEVAKFLREAGLEPTGDVKADLAGFKEWKESQKTVNDKLKDQETATETARREAREARTEAEALRRGVSDKLLPRFLKLASGYEGETVADQVAAALADFPEFAGAEKKDIGAGSKNQQIDGNDAALNALKKQYMHR